MQQPAAPALFKVTPRLWVVGRPSARGTNAEERRASPAALRALLDLEAGGGNWALFNASSKGRAEIDYGALGNAVSEWQPYSTLPGLQDDLPGLGSTFRLLHCLAFWQAWGGECIAALCCNTSLRRSGFLAAAHVAHSTRCGMDAALAQVSLALCGEAGALAAAHFTPAWRYLARGMDALLRAPPSLARAHTVEYLVLTLPRLKALLAGAPPELLLFEGGACVFSSALDCVAGQSVRWEGEEQLVLEMPRNTVLCGDVALYALFPGGAAALAAQGGGLQPHSPLPPRPAAGADAGAGAGTAAAAAAAAAAPGQLPRRLILRAAFHTSLVDAGVAELAGRDMDVFAPALATPAALAALRLCLVLTTLTPEAQAAGNVGRLQAHSYLGLEGALALAAGASSYASHAYVFPLPALLAALHRAPSGAGDSGGGGGGGSGAGDASAAAAAAAAGGAAAAHGLQDLAACCALQRANNDLGRAREFMDCALFRRLFREGALERELRLLKETLSSEELALALAARFDVAVKRRGPALWELDVSKLLEGARLGRLVVGGAGGTGQGSGGGGRRRRKGGRPAAEAAVGAQGGARAAGSSGSSSGSGSGSGSDSSGSSARAPRDKAAGAAEAAAAAAAAAATAAAAAAAAVAAAATEPPPTAGGLFAAFGEAQNEGAEAAAGEGGPAGGEEGEGGQGEDERIIPWTMSDHPIFSKWLAQLRSGISKAQLIESTLQPGAWNPAILDLAAEAVIPPALPATAQALTHGSWPLLQKFSRMASMGLPRPVIEHAMSKECLSAALLDAEPGSVPMAASVSPPHVIKGTRRAGPQVKKLFWTAAVRGGRGMVEGTFWGGPPGDICSASRALIPNEAAFAALWVQDSAEVAKRKAAAAAAAAAAALHGVITLFDPRRSQNAGIALAKLSAPPAAIVAAVAAGTCRLPAPGSAGGGGGGGGAAAAPVRLLSAKDLGAAIELSPTPEERALLKAFTGDATRLGAAERFALGTLGVSAFAERARGLLLQCEWGERTAFVRDKAALLEAAVGQVRSAGRLRRVCKAVLVLGNKMNLGTPALEPKAQPHLVRAFTLGSLQQLQLTRSWDASTSVLTYLQGLLKEGGDEDAMLLASDFAGLAVLREARRLPTDAVREEVSALRARLTALCELVRADAQAGGGVVQAGGMEATWEEEEVVVGSTTDEGEEGAPAAAAAPAPAPAGRGGGRGAAAASGAPPPAQRAKKRRKPVVKRVKRRTEPLPQFAALAQAALEDVSRSIEDALAQFAGLLEWMKEEATLAPAEYFATLHEFVVAWGAELGREEARKKKERAARRAARVGGKRGGAQRGGGGKAAAAGGGEDAGGEEGDAEGDSVIRQAGAARRGGGGWAGDASAVNEGAADAPPAAAVAAVPVPAATRLPAPGAGGGTPPMAARGTASVPAAARGAAPAEAGGGPSGAAQGRPPMLLGGGGGGSGGGGSFLDSIKRRKREE